MSEQCGPKRVGKASLPCHVLLRPDKSCDEPLSSVVPFVASCDGIDVRLPPELATASGRYQSEIIAHSGPHAVEVPSQIESMCCSLFRTLASPVNMEMPLPTARTKLQPPPRASHNAD